MLSQCQINKNILPSILNYYPKKREDLVCYIINNQLVFSRVADFLFKIDGALLNRKTLYLY